MSDEQTETMLRNVREGLAMDGTNPAPSAVTREQVECTCKPSGEHCWLCLYGTEAAKELTQQAQEIERLKDKIKAAKVERDVFARMEAQNVTLHGKLAAMTTERDEWKKAAQQYNGTYEQLQTTLTARERRIAELEGEA